MEMEEDKACVSSPSMEELHPRSLLDIPWEDILFRKVFPFLPLPSLFRLREVSHKCHHCIEEYFMSMHELNLTHYTSRITVEAFKHVSYNSGNLRRLVLRNSKWLTSPLIIPVFDVTSQLVVVDLTNCCGLQNEAVHKLAVSAPGLQELILRECHWLSREGLMVVSGHCRDLRRLDITACWEIDDQAVITLIMFCKKLEYLSVAKIYGLTDQSIHYLAHNCQTLQHLNMQGCWRVTDDAIRLLGQKCRHLRGLQIRECSSVTEVSLARLRVSGVKVDIPKKSYAMDPNNVRYLKQLNASLAFI